MATKKKAQRRGRYVTAPTLDPASLEPTRRLPLADAVRIIGAGIAKPGESVRDARDRARKAIYYAKQKGEIAELRGGGFQSSRVAGWARRKWPGQFETWPAQVTIRGTAPARLSITGGRLEVMPPTIEACHARLAELEKEAAGLEAENARLRAELAAIERKREADREKARRRKEREREGW